MWNKKCLLLRIRDGLITFLRNSLNAWHFEKKCCQFWSFLKNSISFIAQSKSVISHVRYFGIRWIHRLKSTNSSLITKKKRIASETKIISKVGRLNHEVSFSVMLTPPRSRVSRSVPRPVGGSPSRGLIGREKTSHYCIETYQNKKDRGTDDAAASYVFQIQKFHR